MINVRRTRPTGNWGADLKIDYGQYNRRNYGLVVNLPKVANIATKLYGFRKKADQFMTNIVTGDRAHGDNQTNYGASFLWTPTDDLDVQLSVDRYKDRSHYTSSFALSLPGNFFCDAFGIGLGLTSVCAPGSGDIVKASGYKRSFSPPGLSNIYMPMSGDNVILNANWDLGAYTLTSVTGFLSERDQKNSELSGAVDTVGGTPVVGTNGITYFVGGAPVFEVRRQEKSHQFSEELRVATQWQGRLNMVAGLYLLEYTFDFDGQGFGPSTPGPIARSRWRAPAQRNSRSGRS